MVQFAKYAPNAKRIHKERILEPVKTKGQSRSPLPWLPFCGLLLRSMSIFVDTSFFVTERGTWDDCRDRDMTKTATVTGTEIIIAEAEAPTTTKMMVKEGMMMSGRIEAEARLLEVLLFVEAALVLKEAILLAHHPGMKVQENMPVRKGLQRPRVCHLVNSVLILAVNLFGNLVEI